MKFVITAGGTAGHINPALALADELKSRGHNIVFAGTTNRLESKLVPNAGYLYIGFGARGFNRKKPLSIFPAVASTLKATKNAKQWLKSQAPDAVIGFGCYVSISICRAANKLKIPYIIHEQNSVMGMANKYLSRNSQVTCLTYRHADNGKSKHVEITGTPVRQEVFDASFLDGRKMLNVPQDAKMMLVFGGSLGAAKINRAIINMASQLLGRKDLYIVHISGEKQYEECINSLNLDTEKNKRYQILSYQNEMPKTLAAADMCISRAGASTIAELTAKKLPAIIIPYPNATENHQFYNAQELVEAGCVKLINDDEVDSEKFRNYVYDLVDDKNLRDRMSNSYEKFDAKNSAKKIADILENL